MLSLRPLISQTLRTLLEAKQCAPTTLYNETTVRTRVMFKKAYGGKRRVPHFRIKPEPHKYRWIVHYPKDGEYTDKSLRVTELAGRDPETGHRVLRRAGRQALRRNYLWIDYKFTASPGETVEEKVYSVRQTPYYNFLIALVARNGVRRWIVASENCKPGDIIKTHNILPNSPVNAREGEVWPVGALAPGTLIHNFEVYPGEGGRHCRYAGTCAEVLRKIGNMVIVKKPNGNEISIDQRCFACIGRVSNPDHYTVSLVFAQRMRWKGGHPNLGTKRKKDGYCGRKLHPPIPLQVFDVEKRILPPKPEFINLDRV